MQISTRLDVSIYLPKNILSSTGEEIRFHAESPSLISASVREGCLECFSDIGNVRTALRRVGFSFAAINHRWLLSAYFSRFFSFLFYSFFPPSTAMPREPYAKIGEKAERRVGRRCCCTTIPLPSFGFEEVIRTR